MNSQPLGWLVCGLATLSSAIAFGAGAIGGSPKYVPPSSEAENLLVINGTLYFSADDGTHGRELWKLRSLTSAPEMISDITPGPEGTKFSKFSSVNGKLLFRVERDDIGQVWVSDGNKEGTMPIMLTTQDRMQDFYGPGMTIGDRRILIYRGMSISGDFWITDGTSAGTKSISSRGAQRPYTIRYTGYTAGKLGDRVLFRAAGDGNIAGLFITDGTDEGTRQVVKVWDGPGEIQGMGDFALFAGTAQDTGEELWITRGTPDSTRILTDLYPGPQGSSPGQFAVVKGRAYFAATTSEFGRELWTSDGTTEGTHLLKDIFEGKGSSDPNRLTASDNGVFFIATTPDTGRELWSTRGTPESTFLKYDLFAGPQSSNPYNFAVVRDSCFFSAKSDKFGEELFVTNLEASGARLLADIYEGVDSSEPSDTVFFPPSPDHDLIVFAAIDKTRGKELFFVDHRSPGAQLIADINTDGARNPSSFPQEMTAMPNALVFVADDIEHGAELWTTDGTQANTRLLCDIFKGRSGSNPQELTLFGDQVYFRAEDADNGVELWSTDGTTAGTRMVKDIAINASSFPHEFTPMGTKLFFVATTPEAGAELYVLDGDDVHMVHDIAPGKPGSDPTGLTVWNGRLYFRAHDLQHGDELWSTNGTVPGTSIVRDIVPVPVALNGEPAGVPFNGGLFFAHDDGKHGSELWQLTEISPQGTLVKDIAEGFRFR